MDASYLVPAVIVVSRETGEITDIRMEEVSGEEVKAFWGDLERIVRATDARKEKEEKIS